VGSLDLHAGASVAIVLMEVILIIIVGGGGGGGCGRCPVPIPVGVAEVAGAPVRPPFPLGECVPVGDVMAKSGSRLRA
jgi:hypothetical protein